MGTIALLDGMDPADIAALCGVAAGDIAKVNGEDWPAGGSSDPDFANVQLLLHFEGSDGSTTFTDSSGTPKTVTASGNAQIDTAQFKFGAASGLFDGNGDYLSVSSASFSSSQAARTWECWVRLNTKSGLDFLFDNRPNNGTTGWALYFNAGVLTLYDGPANTSTAGSTSVSTGVWYHVAAAHSSGPTPTCKVFLDGVQEISVAMNNDAQTNLRIGNHIATTTLGIDGWMDEVRFTVGVNRYPSAFTPPSAAFPDS